MSCYPGDRDAPGSTRQLQRQSRAPGRSKTIKLPPISQAPQLKNISLQSCFVSSNRFTDAVTAKGNFTDEGAGTSFFKDLNSWHITFTNNLLLWLKECVTIARIQTIPENF